MAKPHSPLLWRQIQTISPTLRTSAQTCVTYNRKPRAFHTSPTRSASARQAPSMRRAEIRNIPMTPLTHKLPNGLKLDRDGLWWGIITRDVNIMLKDLEPLALQLYENMSNTPLMPPNVNFETFRSVLVQVIKLSHSVHPAAQNIRTISSDVDAVFRIGLVLNFLPSGPLVVEWLKHACAKANSRRAVLEVVNTYIEIPGIDIHRNTEPIAVIKDLALKDEWPPAIMLYAKILTWRGEYTKATELLEQKILPFIKPTAKPPHFFEDVTCMGKVDSPLRLYGLAIAEQQGMEAVTKVMHRAAMEYSEPIALMELAISQLEKPDYDAYEEYMAMAATSGNEKASFFLANYYYKIFAGEIQSRDEREAEKKIARKAENPDFRPLEYLQEWIDSVVHKPLSRNNYMQLALEWYAISFSAGNPEAGLILCLMQRAAGGYSQARQIFDAIDEHRVLMNVPAKALRELKTRWDDPTFDPGLPPKLLGLS